MRTVTPVAPGAPSVTAWATLDLTSGVLVPSVISADWRDLVGTLTGEAEAWSRRQIRATLTELRLKLSPEAPTTIPSSLMSVAMLASSSPKKGSPCGAAPSTCRS